MPRSLPLLVVGLTGLSLLGAYCGPILMSSNGFGDASWMYFIQPRNASVDGFPGAPKPVFREYTGAKSLDDALAALVAYFSAIFDGKVAPQFSLYVFWAFFQFMPLSVLVVFEGLRVGNRGKIAGWTSAMLFFAQVLSWQFLLPLWVILYLLTSPIAKVHVPASKSSLLVEVWDIRVLPLTVLLTFVLPTVAMYLPPSMISAKNHYASIAFWQPFPVWHSLLHIAITTMCRSFSSPYRSMNGSGKTTSDLSAYLSLVRGVYGLVFLAGVFGQLPILLFTLAPSNFLSSLVEALPWLKPYATSSVSLYSVFVPWLPWNGPTVNPETIGSGDLAPTAIFFLHYDMYIGCGALLLWAIYLHQGAVANNNIGKTVSKAAMWLSFGGFSAAVAALLWERDRHVFEESEDSWKKKA